MNRTFTRREAITPSPFPQAPPSYSCNVLANLTDVVRFVLALAVVHRYAKYQTQYYVEKGSSQLEIALGRNAFLNGFTVEVGPDSAGTTTVSSTSTTTTKQTTTAIQLIGKPLKPDKAGILLRVNCGGDTVTDALGNKWKSDIDSNFTPSGKTEL